MSVATIVGPCQVVPDGKVKGPFHVDAIKARGTEAGIPSIAFKYAENSSQMQPTREQAGTFADSIKLWR